MCRKLFLNTLDVCEKAVLNWLKKPSISKTVSKKNTQNRGYLTNAMESHYCRADTPKKYLLPEWRTKKEAP